MPGSANRLFVRFSVAALCVSPSLSVAADRQVMEAPTAGTGLPQIVDGRQESETDWPATFRFFADDQFYCTSTMIGNRTILTAAHCIDPEKEQQIKISDRLSIKLTCDVHPQYRRFDLFSDIALCYSASDLPRTRQIAGSSMTYDFENLDLKITRVKLKTPIYFLGFGCRKYPDGTNGAAKTTGQLYGGLAVLSALPRGPGEHFRTLGGVAICPGDSGGAAYVLSDTEKPAGPRSVIGLNSGYNPVGKVSDITTLYSLEKFVRDWAEDNATKICGVHDGAEHCRAGYLP